VVFLYEFPIGKEDVVYGRKKTQYQLLSENLGKCELLK